MDAGQGWAPTSRPPLVPVDRLDPVSLSSPLPCRGAGKWRSSGRLTAAETGAQTQRVSDPRRQGWHIHPHRQMVHGETLIDNLPRTQRQRTYELEGQLEFQCRMSSCLWPGRPYHRPSLRPRLNEAPADRSGKVVPAGSISRVPQCSPGQNSQIESPVRTNLLCPVHFGGHSDIHVNATAARAPGVSVMSKAKFESATESVSRALGQELLHVRTGGEARPRPSCPGACQ